MPLNHATMAMIEYHKAKRLHWDPRDLDFSRDQADWATLAERERAGTLQLCTQFLVGETAVTHDLAPLLIGMRRRGGRLEDEMFLAAQLYEEAKHTEFFDRWLTEVAQADGGWEGELTPSYRALFLDRLPRVLSDCMMDPTPLSLALASATYHIIIEGVMAETGYHVFAQGMQIHGLFPGLMAGVHKVQQDEARHIAYGLSLLRGLVNEEPTIWPAVMASLQEGLMLATGSLGEAFARWGDDVPFGLSPNEALTFAARQFTKRLAVLEQR